MVETLPDKITHDKKPYSLEKEAGRGGCGIVGIYELEGHRMAVKFNLLVNGVKPPGNTLNAEELNLTRLWQLNPNFKHIPEVYGSYCLPSDHLKLEYLEVSIQDYLSSHMQKLSLVELAL